MHGVSVRGAEQEQGADWPSFLSNDPMVRPSPHWYKVHFCESLHGNRLSRRCLSARPIRSAEPPNTNTCHDGMALQRNGKVHTSKVA